MILIWYLSLKQKPNRQTPLNMINSIYAILKNGRRFEDVNYLEKEAAKARLNSIISSRKAFYSKARIKEERSNFEIVKLEKPNKAW